jgi:hypothetical protein
MTDQSQPQQPSQQNPFVQSGGGSSLTIELQGEVIQKGTTILDLIGPNLTASAVSLGTTSMRVINSTFVFNVVDPQYGADPTGTHPSSAAITAAITACANAGGGIVYFPAGTYLSETSQAVPVGIIVCGDGFLASIVNFTGATNGFVLSSKSVQVGANIIKDLKITTDNPSSQDGVYVHNRYNVRIKGTFRRGLSTETIDHGY